jgi:hypothetical protein
MPIGIEGLGASPGTATIGTLYAVNTPSDADTLFGPTSRLAQLCKFVLTRGAGPLLAGASSMTTAPTLLQRQAVWDNLSSDPIIRLRLTDSVLSSDLAALGTSLTNAESAPLYNKQVAIVGLASGTTKAQFITAAAAVAHKRMALVGPSMYDENGTLRDSGFSAAAVAAEVAKNNDPTNDLDLWTLPYTTGIEKDTNGYPIFRLKTVGGVGTNDFEDLLQAGVSPLRQAFGSVAATLITHLRTTFIADGSFDSLQTRLIVDQVFIDVRDYIRDKNFLRQQNTPDTRNQIASGVEALLFERRSWVAPKTQSDGTLGYNVQVTSSPDNRQVTVAYEGTVVRGISTVQVAASLDIPV